MKGFVFIRLALVFIVLIAGVIGVALGLGIAITENIEGAENFSPLDSALPTRLYAASGEMITEFSADEKRELITLNELPRHLILATLAREDPDFYNHRGFSLRAIARAAIGEITRNPLGGGSTITQQVAGTLYLDRRERTITRKIRELWWAIQMERRYTKNEILEIYLNHMIMGPGLYGVEAASKYFFGHSARDLSLAEAAVLVVQLSSPTRFNPIHNPEEAMDRQKSVLDRMVELGYASREEADFSFMEYWDNFDLTRLGLTAFFSREDKAPWFSEYVRRELDRLMYGEMDYYRDGYVVHTTLDLRFQNLADEEMAAGIIRANANHQRSAGFSTARAERVYVPLANMLTLVFNMEGIFAATEFQDEIKAANRYGRELNYSMDLMSLVFDIQDLKPMVNASNRRLRAFNEERIVEGALIVLENDTGQIKAIVGGSDFNDANQLIRATQSRVMPGSAFKPLFYSAAIDSRQFTMATQIFDAPILFYSAVGEPYVPNNYGGAWRGSVLLFEALGLSLNIPALKVLDGIGFDAAINRSAALLGVTDPGEISRNFPRVYPLGLGISAVTPLSMARAFAIFANQGREVIPYAIRTIEDRNGRIIVDNDRDMQQRTPVQVISPQNSFIMNRLLSMVLEVGTLAGHRWKFNNIRDDRGNPQRMPVAGKTGTTQNWSDAWVVGYTPYYTLAIWFGFDRGGNSLGMHVTGESLVAPIWSDLLVEFNQGLPRRDFPRPSGIVDATVCRESGLLPSGICSSFVSLQFLAGTIPSERCDGHGGSGEVNPWSFDWQGLVIPEDLQSLFSGDLSSFSSPALLESEDPEIPDYDPLHD